MSNESSTTRSSTASDVVRLARESGKFATFEEVLREAVDAAGGPKRVGSLLFPTKDAIAAARYLSDCLNPQRNEKLDAPHLLTILRLARDAGHHEAKHWLDRQSGYAPTPPVEVDDERAELARVLRTASETMRDALAALARLEEGRR